MKTKKKHLLLVSRIFGFLLLVVALASNSITSKPSVQGNKIDFVEPTSYQITPDNLPETPFDIIAEYYGALARLDWQTIENITTPALRAYIRSDVFRNKWEDIVAKNEGLEFIMFLVSNQTVNQEKGEAFALGKVHWRSKTGNIENYNQTVLLTRTSEGWKIKELKSSASVEIVEDFYQAISNKDWATLENLTTPKYWAKLKAAGVIDSLIKERIKFEKQVYIFFLVNEFWEGKKTAFVSGDVTWKPLSNEFAESKVTIRLLKRNGKWKVDNIVGHWKLDK